MTPCYLVRLYESTKWLLSGAGSEFSGTGLTIEVHANRSSPLLPFSLSPLLLHGAASSFFSLSAAFVFLGFNSSDFL